MIADLGPRSWRWVKALELLAECKNRRLRGQPQQGGGLKSKGGSDEHNLPLPSRAPQNQQLKILEDGDDEELVQFNVALANEGGGGPSAHGGGGRGH
mmetsp:Transcript_18396/g.25853  ORF Transcript_18396/g.25853 Transcript_18396/m.25853 type:complete len:97 (+) Transcript_18396:593-883(+)